MPRTLVIQSHRAPLPRDWLRACLGSVSAWATSLGYDYRFIGDELFEPLAEDLVARTAAQPVVATDLARLYWLERGLDEGYQRVVWCDADFLVFAPESFRLPDADCAVGRETWIQHDERDRLRVYPKVHNAFLMFCQDNHLLEFYRASAERLVRLNEGRMPPQYIGPKFLSALHNIAQLPVLETAGMLSPLVLRDLAAGGGDALELFREHSPEPVSAANLCASLSEEGGTGVTIIEAAIERLLSSGV